ncbi:hypothetical protein B0H14DRAFT_3864869 [Mycena olivaceomarginata]|nr:hypothetical protein B0H14DRAFT_3864869 [Mycena olivaceomarginata]
MQSMGIGYRAVDPIFSKIAAYSQPTSSSSGIFCALPTAPSCRIFAACLSSDSRTTSSNRYFDEIAVDLRGLTGIRELKLYLSCQYTVPSDARAFFCTGFFTAFQTVTRLVLSVHCVLDMIGLFPALRELHILHSRFFLDSDILPSAPPPRGLRSFKITENVIGPMLLWLNRSNQLPSIDTLTLSRPHVAHIPTVRVALQQLGGALLHLSIDLALFQQAIYNTRDPRNPG